ncbi:Hypothetical predicted protein, partial [Paramuricea clavata]
TKFGTSSGPGALELVFHLNGFKRLSSGGAVYCLKVTFFSQRRERRSGRFGIEIKCFAKMIELINKYA